MAVALAVARVEWAMLDWNLPGVGWMSLSYQVDIELQRRRLSGEHVYCGLAQAHSHGRKGSRPRWVVDVAGAVALSVLLCSMQVESLEQLLHLGIVLHKVVTHVAGHHIEGETRIVCDNRPVRHQGNRERNRTGEGAGEFEMENGRRRCCWSSGW